MLARILSILGLVLASACADEPAPAHAEAPQNSAVTTAEVGKPAPDFSLNDLDGKAVTLRGLRGKTVVLEWWNPDCPFVRHAHGEGPLKDFAQRVADPNLIWLTINSGAPGKQGHGVERSRSGKAEYAMVNTILLDETGKVGRAYGAAKTPHLFVIDAKGTLAYRGGLDNAPIGKVDDQRPRLPATPAGALEPYLQLALDDVAQKRALRLADTPAYGCSVKYAN